MNRDRINGLGIALYLHLRGDSREDIDRTIEQVSEGFVFMGSQTNFLSGAKQARALIEELETLRAAAIEHAKEAEKEAEKAEQVLESVSDDRQLPLPIESQVSDSDETTEEDVPDSGEGESENEES